MGRRRRRRPHGGGQVVPPEIVGGTWAIRWREAGRRRYRGGLATREIAERVLAKIVGDVARGRAGLQQDPRDVPALGELATGFLERRRLTHRAAADDDRRWTKHLAPHFAALKPSQVDTAAIRAFIEAKRAEGLAPGTLNICIAVLSSLFEDLAERKLVEANPCRRLPRSVRRLIKADHDPRTTPFVERLDDVKRLYLRLPEPVSIAYAIGALAGLRTGEVIALRWCNVDLGARRIHVRESAKGPLKDDVSRVAPILDSLVPILTAWKLKSGGQGRVIPSLQLDGDMINRQTLWKELRAALKALGFPEAAWRPGTQRTLTWYRATRHTFASHWVMAGGSIEKLKEMLGHCTVVITERYSHLRVDLFAEHDLATVSLDMRPGAAQLGAVGQSLGRESP